MSEPFIGGPADGDHYEVPPSAQRFYVRGGLYHREHIGGQDRRICVWRWDGITTDECLLMLLERYNF